MTRNTTTNDELEAHLQAVNELTGLNLGFSVHKKWALSTERGGSDYLMGLYYPRQSKSEMCRTLEICKEILRLAQKQKEIQN